MRSELMSSLDNLATVPQIKSKRLSAGDTVLIGTALHWHTQGLIQFPAQKQNKAKNELNG